MDSQSESWDSGGPHQFPAGLRVLVVDDDATCLKVIERMLKKCQYTVTTCSRAVMALEILRENKEGFDIVLSDVHMPDMDGFKLLVHIGLEMDLPVIMMSADDGKDVVMKGVTHGACDYLIKPVSMKALQNIWQHVFRKKRSEAKDLDDSGSLDDGYKQKKPLDDGDSASSGSWKVAKRKKEGGDEDELEDSSALKKSRVVWSVDLHQRFVAAVNQLGLEKAVPKKILELMNEPTLTRENVASHLQKYRLYLKRLSVPQHQGRADTSFSSPADASFNQVSSFDEFDLQALIASGQVPPQTLMTLHPVLRRVPNNSMGMPTVDQRGFSHSDVRSAMVQKLNNNQVSLYSTPRLAANPSTGMPTSDQRVFFNSDAQLADSSHIRPRMMQQLNNNQMSVLYGSSTSMVPRHIGQAQQVFQVSEGTQGFMSVPSSLGTDSPFPGGSGGHLTNPFVTQMNQQGQQISLAQQQDPRQYGVQKQPQSRGQLLGGISNGRQMVSTGLTNHVFVRKGTEVKGVTPLQGNYMTMSQSGTVPQSLYSNVQNGNTSTSNCHPHVSSIVAPPGRLATLSDATGLTHDIYSDLHQSKNECWKLRNGNHSFEAKRRDVDYDFSLLDHHHSNAILEDGAAINSCTVGKEIFDGLEIKHEKVEYFSQDLLFSDDGFPNELMSVVKR